MPEELQKRLVVVPKVQIAFDEKGNRIQQKTNDLIWIPDEDELRTYDMDSNASLRLLKRHSGFALSKPWWLRSASALESFKCVTVTGSTDACKANWPCGVLIGFCL